MPHFLLGHAERKRHFTIFLCGFFFLLIALAHLASRTGCFTADGEAMSHITVKHTLNPSEEQIEEAVEVFAANMFDDPATKAFCGGDMSLMHPFTRAGIRAGILAGEFYAATDESTGRLVGYALCLPPGQVLLSTPEQRALGFDDFFAKLPKDVQEFWGTVGKRFGDFLADTLGPTGRIDSWYMNHIFVLPEWQGQGIATSVIAQVREKAVKNGDTVALSATNPYNVPIYQALGFDLKGEMMVTSAWGDYPIYAFSLDATAV
ncbi:uncharacterized protein FIBRA_06031 [Fibroporia radiculosa]|uniref:N-acetyltransferase domain-containing protein n=1 Tax=Fibroporia radiculosa TaxID=599839 RepID=J4GS29_9APHY|nr:uncharacterized protein FIBRA_06031 [Fibroporia radiculosa]CCM03880.1 predicted protein [Fibroporia radiculosa]